jgi:hypothetical protein
MSDNKTCSFCDKMAIGYETRINCGVCVCEDHASERLLSMKPGETFDEKGDMLSWEFLQTTGKLVPVYLNRFQDDPSKIEPKEILPQDLWTIDICADILMVHREDIRTLIQKRYLKTEEREGKTYVTRRSLHQYIEYRCKYGFLLPIFWRDNND